MSNKPGRRPMAVSAKKVRVTVTIPPKVAKWLKKQVNVSAVVSEAVRDLMERESTS